MDSQTESFLFLTNEGGQAARIGFSVTANGVHYYLTKLKLQPHETRAINFRALRDAQAADFKQHQIPASATDGAVNCVRIDNVPVEGQVEVIRRDGGAASLYNGGVCPCPDSFAGDVVISPASFTLSIDSSLYLLSTATYSNCNGNLYYYNVTDSTAWSSSDASVITLTSLGQAQGVGGGSATITGTFSDVRWHWNPVIGCESFPLNALSKSTTYVQVPTFLSLVGTKSAGPVSNCQMTINEKQVTGAGWQRVVTWQVLDQNRNPILASNMSPADSLANAGGANTCLFPPKGGNTGTGTTNFLGQFPDTYTTCSTACLNNGTCQSTESQSWSINGTALSKDVKTVVFTCTSVVINNQ